MFFNNGFSVVVLVCLKESSGTYELTHEQDSLGIGIEPLWTPPPQKQPDSPQARALTSMDAKNRSFDSLRASGEE